MIKETTSRRWLFELFLVTIWSVLGFAPVSASAAGTTESEPEVRAQSSKPGPKRIQPGAAHSTRPERPGRPRGSGDTVEERLRRGEADAPIAQGQISDRLNRMYQEHPAAQSGDDKPAGPPSR